MAGANINIEEIITNVLDLLTFVCLTPEVGRIANVSIRTIVWLMLTSLSIILLIATYIIAMPGLLSYITTHKDSSYFETGKMVITYSRPLSFTSIIVLSMAIHFIIRTIPNHFMACINAMVTKISKQAALLGILLFFLSKIIAFASAIGYPL